MENNSNTLPKASVYQRIWKLHLQFGKYLDNFIKLDEREGDGGDHAGCLNAPVPIQAFQRPRAVQREGFSIYLHQVCLCDRQAL